MSVPPTTPARRLGALTLALATVGACLATATPAHAADGTCRIGSFSPTSVTVGFAEKSRTFAVKTSGCRMSYWDIDIKDGPLVPNENPELTFDRGLENADAGSHDVTVYAANADGVESSKTFRDAFRLLRRTEWRSFNASPEPVRKGAKITVKGQLVRANWDTEKYAPYTGRKAAVQFKVKGSSTWKTVKTATTSSSGWISTTVTAGQDGTFRLSYAASSLSGASLSSSDFVDVR